MLSITVLGLQEDRRFGQARLRPCCFCGIAFAGKPASKAIRTWPVVNHCLFKPSRAETYKKVCLRHTSSYVSYTFGIPS